MKAHIRARFEEAESGVPWQGSRPNRPCRKPRQPRRPKEVNPFQVGQRVIMPSVNDVTGIVTAVGGEGVSVQWEDVTDVAVAHWWDLILAEPVSRAPAEPVEPKEPQA